jgi:hypothetical protein
VGLGGLGRGEGKVGIGDLIETGFRNLRKIQAVKGGGPEVDNRKSFFFGTGFCMFFWNGILG